MLNTLIKRPMYDNTLISVNAPDRWPTRCVMRVLGGQSPISRNLSGNYSKVVDYYASTMLVLVSIPCSTV